MLKSSPISGVVGIATADAPLARSLAQRASLTAVASLLDYGSRLAVGVAITPILVTQLGQSLFGTWEILLRLVGYMSAADGRPMEALRLVVANRQGMSDPATNRRTVGMAVGVWMLFLPVVAVLAALVIWIAPQLVKAPPEVDAVVRITSVLLVVNFIVLTLAALPEAVLFGTNQGFRRMGLVAGVNIAGGALTIAAVRSRMGLPGMAAAQLVMTLVTALLFLMLAKRYVEWFGIARPSREELRWFTGLSGWSVAGDAVAKLLLASDVVLLGYLASASLVTSYVLTGYAAQAVVGIVTLVIGATAPGLAGVVGRREYDRAWSIRREILVIGWLAGTIVGSVILLWNRAFMHLWVGMHQYAGAWANVLLVLVMVQTIMIRTDASVINAFLRLRERVLISAFAFLLCCGLAFALVPSLGIAGLCLAILSARLTQSIGYPILVNVSLGKTATCGLGALARPALVTTSLFATCAYAGSRVLVTSWTQWASGVAATMALMLAAVLLIGLPVEPRRTLVGRLRTTIGWV